MLNPEPALFAPSFSSSPERSALLAVRRPLYRADHVGSLLRMPELKAARARFKDGLLSREELTRAENLSVERVVRIQEEAGLKSITDGEQRRNFFHVDFFEKIRGVSVSIAGYEIRFRGGSKDVTLAPPIMQVTGKLARPAEGIVLQDFSFLKSAVNPANTAKVCIPSPSMLHFRGGRKGIDELAYPDMESFFQELSAIYREEIAALYDAGCRYIQIDDTNLAYLCDPAHRQRAQALGEKPDALPALYARLISQCLQDRPDDLYVALHLCRGNHRSAWAAEGGYDPVAEVMFNQTDVDAFFLEYDDPRSGDFSPLRFVPSDKAVVLGLVSSKRGELESREEVKRRIDEAGRYIDLEQCALSPQCGFSSTHEGNELSYLQQFDKLVLVVQLTEEIWG